MQEDIVRCLEQIISAAECNSQQTRMSQQNQKQQRQQGQQQPQPQQSQANKAGARTAARSIRPAGRMGAHTGVAGPRLNVGQPP